MGLLGIFLQSSSSKIDENWNWSSTRRYVAAFTTDDDENFVRQNLGTGFSLFSLHPTDASQLITSIEVTSPEETSKYADPTEPGNTTVANFGTDCLWWQVDIEYGAPDPLTHILNLTYPGNPTYQPVCYSFTVSCFEQAMDYAYNPSTDAYEACVNSAGDPFDPPITLEVLKFSMDVVWNATTYSPSTYATYGNCINSDVWNGFPIGSVKFTPPSMDERPYSQVLGLNYYRLKGRFDFYTWPSAWNANPIDRGFNALDGSGNKYKIIDVNGQPVSQPVRLNGSGGVLTSLSGYYAYNYQRYTSINFASTFPALTSLFP